MQLIATRGICEHQNGCQANKAPPGAPSLNWRVRPSQPTANRLVAAKQQQPALACQATQPEAQPPSQATSGKPPIPRGQTNDEDTTYVKFDVCEFHMMFFDFFKNYI